MGTLFRLANDLIQESGKSFIRSAITELRTFLMPLLWLTSEVAKALKLTDSTSL